MPPMPRDQTDQAPAHIFDPAEPAESGMLERAPLAREEAAPGADRAWDSATEQEWSEHSATAWALAHVIHHIHTTPLPPFLLPEQRDHFQHIIQTAAALIEDWQRRERERARQLAISRPVTGLTQDSSTANQDALSQHPVAEGPAEQAPSRPHQPPMEDALDEQGADEAKRNHKI